MSRSWSSGRQPTAYGTATDRDLLTRLDRDPAALEVFYRRAQLEARIDAERLAPELREALTQLSDAERDALELIVR